MIVAAPFEIPVTSPFASTASINSLFDIKIYADNEQNYLQLDTSSSNLELEEGIIYTFGEYQWQCVEKIKNGLYILQSQGMTSGSWPGYKLASGYNNLFDFYGIDQYYDKDISYINIANYDNITQEWYNTYKNAEIMGGLDENGVYNLSNPKNGLYLIPTIQNNNEKNTYYEPIMRAVTYYQNFGASEQQTWFGTIYYDQYIDTLTLRGFGSCLMSNTNLVLAPAFNLDISKVNINHSNNVITLK